MAHPDDQPLEILVPVPHGGPAEWSVKTKRYLRRNALLMAAETLATNRFIIRWETTKMVTVIAAHLVIHMAHPDSALQKEARSLIILADGRDFNPSVVGSVLSSRRKQWRKEERAKIEDQGPA